MDEQPRRVGSVKWDNTERLAAVGGQPRRIGSVEWTTRKGWQHWMDNADGLAPLKGQEKFGSWIITIFFFLKMIFDVKFLLAVLVFCQTIRMCNLMILDC